MNLKRFGGLIWKNADKFAIWCRVPTNYRSQIHWYALAALLHSGDTKQLQIRLCWPVKQGLWLPYVARIARAHQWVLPSELLVYMKLGWISHEKRGPFWDYQHSLLPCITLALVSASRKTLCKSEQKENIMWEEIARLLFKCQRDSDLFWVLEEMWERDICQILGLPIWLLWTTFLFPLSQ